MLVEAAYRSKRATAEASVYPEQTIEDNVEASIALQIAAAAPSSRQDMEVTINNAATGNPTQITVYAAGAAARSVTSVGVSSATWSPRFPPWWISPRWRPANTTLLRGGGDRCGRIRPGVLQRPGRARVAQPRRGGVRRDQRRNWRDHALGPTSTVPLTSLQIAAQVINTAAEGVGGVYGVVQTAENSNTVGILAGALEAAAAAAAGIGMGSRGSAQQTLNTISAALGAASVASNMGSDFANGNLAQGLIDSLNLYLPAVALAYASSQNNQSNLQSVENADAAAVSSSGNSGTAPAPSSFGAEVPASQLTLASTVSLTTTIEGVTQTTEVSPIGTSSGSGATQGATKDTGTVGVAVQPGVGGTGNAGQNGTDNGEGSVTLPTVDVIASQLPADTIIPTFGSLYLEALQLIVPSAEAAPISTGTQQQGRVATAQGYLNNPNVQAFLSLISTAEGATYNSRYGDKLNGVRSTFNNYSTYPQATSINTPEGRYQIVSGTYNYESSRLGLTDFSPQTQDIMAVDLLVQDGAIGYIVAGNLDGALARASFTWAALPQSATVGSRYDQPYISYSSAVADFNLYRSP